MHIYMYICMYVYMIQKEEINNWILQFFKNEAKRFLVFQKIFYSLLNSGGKG